ncbi:hypothetical protein CAPN002_00260 [Capnocytophaga stomatis]|uniref:hypothetical protein n=1 Tax=Capnocytophaga stomatis TaxID=1848904 RepID=UPI00194EE064|nr:hypothetical protein [Capnocytophaga stomatis]GIJ92808.1 hypothetical protein CAPN002_00260 [Capnocytophaga stomatis]
MTHTLTINIKTRGASFTEKELKNYIEFQLGFGSLSSDNPFIENNSKLEIMDADVVSIECDEDFPEFIESEEY